VHGRRGALAPQGQPPRFPQNGRRGSRGWSSIHSPRRASGAASLRIVIVGAGIAGLTAALALSEAGYASTVYEAFSRIGGRMHSDTTTWANGLITEHCGEPIETSHQTILALPEHLGRDASVLKAFQEGNF